MLNIEPNSCSGYQDKESFEYKKEIYLRDFLIYLSLFFGLLGQKKGLDVWQHASLCAMSHRTAVC